MLFLVIQMRKPSMEIKELHQSHRGNKWPDWEAAPWTATGERQAVRAEKIQAHKDEKCQKQDNLGSSQAAHVKAVRP